MTRAGASQAPLPGVGEGFGEGFVEARVGPLYPATGPSTVYPSWMLPIPGTGDSYEDCGTGIAKKLVCENDPDGHPVVVVGTKSCKRPECPTCWSSWARRATDRTGSRVDGFRDAARHRYPPRHIIISLSANESTDLLDTYANDAERLYKGIKSTLLRKAKAIGVKGGAIVIHFYRIDHLLDNDLSPKEYSVQNHRVWDQVRDSGNWQEVVRFSPHAHIIGYGYLQTPKKGEFKYKNKGPLKSRDDIERASYYMLSHCTLPPKGHAISYFGCCSYNKLMVEKHLSVSAPLLCSVCGAHMIYEDTLHTSYPEIYLVQADISEFVYKGPPI